MALTRPLALAVAAVLSAGGVLGAQPTLQDRILAKECWEQDPASDETYFPPETQAESSSEAADLFDIAYGDTFKVVVARLSKEQYVLTQCGQERPTDAQVEALVALESGYTRKHFTVPLQSTMAMSTVQLGFLEALAVQDRVTHMSSYAVAPCWQKAVSCGSVVEDQYALDFDADKLAAQKAGVDAVLMDCSGADCSQVHDLANGVHVPATQDSGLLATAEYIKFLGAFFNKEHVANEAYAATKQHYQEAYTGTDSARPTVAWVSYTDYGGPSWNQPAVTLSQATYKKEITSMAGGKNVDAKSKLSGVENVSESDAVFGNPAAGKTYTLLVSDFNNDKAQTTAALFAALGTVDVVVDETYAYAPTDYTFESFLSSFGLVADSDLKFVQDRMVLRTDRTLSEGNGLDWFESRISRPDMAVEGLAHELFEDDSMTVRYFRNVAKGDTPDQILVKESCTKVLPVCDTQAFPETIQSPGPTSMATDVGAASETSRAPLLLAVLASLVVAVLA